MADVPIVFDPSVIYEVTERSDIDQHQGTKGILKQLEEQGAEDWGEGFLVEGFVRVDRDKATGKILRTTPLHEIPGFIAREENEPVVGHTRTTPVGLGPSDREKLVDILTYRLFKYYRELGKSTTLYNPVYDGIPDKPDSAAEGLQPLPGTKLYPAAPGEVFLWLKNKVVGPRAELVNKKQGRTGTAQDYALRISR